MMAAFCSSWISTIHSEDNRTEKGNGVSWVTGGFHPYHIDEMQERCDTSVHVFASRHGFQVLLALLAALQYLP
jgi:hypothetical protein